MSAVLYANGRFWPAADGEAGALLARGGRIEALGPAAAARRDEATRVVDLAGRTAIPGPVDAHCHLVSYGMMRTREADLRGAASIAEIVERLREHAGRLRLRPGDGRWLLGRGFDQELLRDARWPARHDLDAAAPGLPARITRVCGHALVVSTPGLLAAGLDAGASSPGFPEGVLAETAMGPVFAAIPRPSAADWLDAARWACREAARVGFVGVHSLMAHGAEVRALVALRREGPLPVRVLMQLPYDLLEPAAAAGLCTGFGDEYLAIGAVKLFSDGSLGARTAALRAPYSDDPGTSGQLIYAPPDLARRVRAVRQAGFQVCVHAIGDRAMDVTLDAIEAATAGPDGAPWAFPPRIEHASMVDAGIVARMLRLGVGAAVQPQFARSDYWVPERLGPDRARGCYAFRTMIEAGIPTAGSTDCPVEEMDAMAALGQAVHRPAWSPGEGVCLEAAVRMFSEGSYALRGLAGGRFAPGHFADFLVLERDPRAAQPEALERVPVAMTVVGGVPTHIASEGIPAG